MPAIFHLLDPLGMDTGEVSCLGPVRSKVIELPWISLGGHQLPVSAPQGAMALVEPPEVLMKGLPVTVEGSLQRPPGRGLFLSGLQSGEIKESWGEVNDMGRCAPQGVALLDARGPVSDKGGGTSPFVDPRLVAAKGGIACGGPARTKAKVSGGGTGWGVGVVAICPHHNFGTGPIIGEKNYEGVVPGVHGAQLLEDSADLLVHPFHHCGMDGHLGLLEGLLLFTELVPRERAIHLTGSKDFKMLGEMIRRAEFSLGLRECPARDSEFLDSAPPLGADSVPTYLVAGFALCDVFRKSVQRKMRGCECDILKKWSSSVIGRVALEMVNGGISYRDSSIVARAPLNGREFHIVLPVCLWTEEAALVLEVIGMLKAIAEGHSVKVPLA